MAPADDLHRTLGELAAQITGDPSVRLTHSCPTCGSSEHGRPVLLSSAGAFGVSLSRPRSGALGVVAVCRDSALGIDLETAGAAAFPHFETVAVHPREHCPDDDARTLLWVRKEALLKAHGTGLITHPRSIRLAPDGTVLEGPAATILDVDLGPEWTCAVAVVQPGASRENIRVIRS